jgi:hypothetical protein
LFEEPQATTERILLRYDPSPHRREVFNMALTKRHLLVLRVLAIAFSTMLVAGFISYRATGHFVPGMASSEAPFKPIGDIRSVHTSQQSAHQATSDPKAIMPSSKMMMLAEPDRMMSSSKFATIADKEIFMGGSKSARAFTPEDEEALGILEATERGVVWDPDKAMKENPPAPESPDTDKP